MLCMLRLERSGGEMGNVGRGLAGAPNASTVEACAMHA